MECFVRQAIFRSFGVLILGSSAFDSALLQPPGLNLAHLGSPGLVFESPGTSETPFWKPCSGSLRVPRRRLGGQALDHPPVLALVVLGLDPCLPHLAADAVGRLHELVHLRAGRRLPHHCVRKVHRTAKRLGPAGGAGRHRRRWRRASWTRRWPSACWTLPPRASRPL